jgi:SAM-dependent methyltransferase
LSGYHELAQFYDLVVGDKSRRVAFLAELIAKHTPHAVSVLELACGTGTLIAGLAGRYEVSGIDLSPEMAARAKEKLPAADVQVGDMSSFDFGSRFDVLLCVYDSVNHLLEWEQWRATFENAWTHLNRGGLFVFDINTPARHDYLIRSQPHIHPIGPCHMFMRASREGAKFRWTVRIFERNSDEQFTLHEAVVYEAAFPFDRIYAEVSKLFRVVEVIDADGLPPGDCNWRPFLVCVKL